MELPLKGLVLVVALFGLVLTGCGGGKSNYSIQPTKACLDGKGLTTSSDRQDLDAPAANARGGGLYVFLSDRDWVTIAFEPTEDDAKDAERTALTLVEGSPNAIMRKGNVVMNWAAKPSDDQSSTVESCLS